MTQTANWTDKTCKDTIWLTPEKILEPVREFFGGDIPLDPATEATNPTKALKFYTKEDNGLKQPWDVGTFVNPPYGKEISLWCKKIWGESTRDATIIALMPCGARFSTKYWQGYILSERLNSICFVKGRVKFLRPDGTPAKQNPYDSQILGFNVDQGRFCSVFSKLGKCLAVTCY